MSDLSGEYSWYRKAMTTVWKFMMMSDLSGEYSWYRRFQSKSLLELENANLNKLNVTTDVHLLPTTYSPGNMSKPAVMAAAVADIHHGLGKFVSGAAEYGLFVAYSRSGTMLVEILTLIFEGKQIHPHREPQTNSEGKWEREFDFCGCKFSEESAEDWKVVFDAIEGVKELMSKLSSTGGKKRIHINAPVLKGENRLEEFISLVQEKQLNDVVALILPLVDGMALNNKDKAGNSLYNRLKDANKIPEQKNLSRERQNNHIVRLDVEGLTAASNDGAVYYGEQFSVKNPFNLPGFDKLFVGQDIGTDIMSTTLAWGRNAEEDQIGFIRDDISGWMASFDPAE
jgi:hypothetical protein